MFIGHYGLALGTRKFSKLPSLAMMFIAVQFLDLLWPVLVLLDIEHFRIAPGNTKMTPFDFYDYPWSHSLFMSVIWGVVLGFLYFLFTKNRSGGILLGALVVSHWVLDLLVHQRDLPLSPFSDTKVGLGLWNYPAAESILEFVIFLGGAGMYYAAVHPVRKRSYWMMILVLLAIHLMNIFGPPPGSAMMVALMANLMWGFVIWAWWIEKPKH
jgi:membrane-bound metal-dependent hydrolase YbcI (DUF457 family)